LINKHKKQWANILVIFQDYNFSRRKGLLDAISRTYF
jgi:hypothetical protein